MGKDCKILNIARITTVLSLLLLFLVLLFPLMPGNTVRALQNNQPEVQVRDVNLNNSGVIAGFNSDTSDSNASQNGTSLSVNVNSVLFTTASDYNKGDFAPVGSDHVGTSWDLTLTDKNSGLQASRIGDGVINDGDVVSVSVTDLGLSTAQYNHITGLLIDRSGSVAAYGFGTHTGKSTGLTGTWDFTIPENLNEGDYVMLIFAEDSSPKSDNENRTDTASEPVQIVLTIADKLIETAEITDVAVPKAGETVNNSAKASGTGLESSEATVSWDPEPTENKFDSNVAYTAAISLKADQGYSFSDNVTATVNGSPASTVIINSDGTLTVRNSFTQTKSLSASDPDSQTEIIQNQGNKQMLSAGIQANPAGSVTLVILILGIIVGVFAWQLFRKN
ncbi:MAG: hypothetical protein ACOYB8_07180 [Eubacteriaceae bacterium]